jgi:hypothetical protein
VLVLVVVLVRAREDRASKAWGETASRLGWRLAPWDPRSLSDADKLRAALGAPPPPPTKPSFTQPMFGLWRGLPATVFVTQQYEMAWIGQNVRQKVFYTVARIMLPRPLGAGLTLSETNILDALVHQVVGTSAVATGHPALDGAFRLTARDPARARAIAIAADDLLRAKSVGSVSASDTWVAIARDGIQADYDAIVRVLDALAPIASRFA